jgi:hypothetical protein
MIGFLSLKVEIMHDGSSMQNYFVNGVSDQRGTLHKNGSIWKIHLGLLVKKE